MTDRMDIKAWRKSRNDKAYTVRLGAAWTDNKGVIRCELDALPVPDADGRVSFFLEAQKEREAPAPRGGRARDDRDDIPFGPETR